MKLSDVLHYFLARESKLLINKSNDDEFTHIVEAWNGDKKLTIYVGDKPLVVRVWGPHVENDMAEYPCKATGELQEHVRWLYSKK